MAALQQLCSGVESMDIEDNPENNNAVKNKASQEDNIPLNPPTTPVLRNQNIWRLQFNAQHEKLCATLSKMQETLTKLENITPVTPSARNRQRQVRNNRIFLSKSFLFLELLLLLFFILLF